MIEDAAQAHGAEYQRPSGRAASGDSAASASIRARTWAPVAKAGPSSPTTPDLAEMIRMLRDWGQASSTITCCRASTTAWRPSRRAFWP